MAEFSGVRSRLYRECLREFPHARDQDILLMKKYLAPKPSETILELGAGSGFFSRVLADTLVHGKLIVSDPSPDQLADIKDLRKRNVILIEAGADKLNLPAGSVDAVWSFGAMHHCKDKSRAFAKCSKVLKRGGRLVIGDVFSDTKLAHHFDTYVARYSVTGHEVSFWSDAYARSLCALHGFEIPKIIPVNIYWTFDSKKDLGVFLYKLHAMTKSSPEACLKSAERILGVTRRNKKYLLHWPMKLIITKKR
jgi:arsenite methyltransferase